MQSNTKKIQELLDVLEATDTSEKTEEESYQVIADIDVYDFLSYYKILPGKHKVKSKSLYLLYKKWSKAPIPLSTFGNKIARYLQYNTNKTFLLTNKDALKYVLPLLDKISKKKTKFTMHKYKRLNDFLNEMGWKSGNHYHAVMSLYYFYDKWTKKNKIKRIDQGAFCVVLGLKFNRKQGRKGTATFGLSEEVHITKQQMNYIIRKFYGKKQKK